MKATNLARAAGVYGLLAGGSLLFLWPFVWMVGTSFKTDRELFGERLHFLPGTPGAAVRSPYIDTGYFRDVTGPAMARALPLIEARLQTLGAEFTVPPEVDHATAVRETARGIYRRLLDLWPGDRWSFSDAALRGEIDRTVTADLAQSVLLRTQRGLRLLQLRARSYDLQEDVLVPADRAAAAWQVSGEAAARIASGRDEGGGFSELHYDFSQGDAIRLRGTFTTAFPVERLHRLQLALRPDDSWHAVTLTVENIGLLYRDEIAINLVDFAPATYTWQEPGPDDATNKTRTWVLLREESRSPKYENDPHRLEVTLEIRRVGRIGAWLAKIRRNYGLVFDRISFGRYVATSLFLAVLNIAGTLASSSLAAYGFARLHWPGRRFCFALLLATMMIPGQLTMIPHFLIIRSLGWYNTLYPLWVGSFFASAFNVFLLRQSMKGVPRDLEDAGRMDGCGFWRLYWHVVLPLVRPALAAVAIFTFMGTWNDFMGPLIYLNDQRLYPLSFGLYALNLHANGSTGMMMAGSLLMTLPVIGIFFFAQRFFLQSVAFSGVK